MVNGNKQQSLFSNPLVLFLVGVGVALIAVLVAVMILQPGGQLKTLVYPSLSPSPSVLVGEYCICNCIADDLDSWLCPTKLNNNQCSNYLYEDLGITDEETCKQKNGTKCGGYDYRPGHYVSEGTYDFCRIKNVALPTSSAVIDWE